MPKTDPPGIGLALSGGAGRGIAHIGVLEALVESGIPIVAVAGTSAGSIVGALFAAGIPLPAIRRIALETRWRDLFRLAVPRAGLISGAGLEDYFERILSARRFSDLKIPFAAVTTDLATGDRVDLTDGSLARAVRASCSIPVLFEPVEIGGRFLVDGGLSSQIPVRTVRETLGVRTVAAIDVNAGAINRSRPEGVAQVALHLALLWSARAAREESPLADVLISVDARDIPLYDLDQKAELLKRGHEAALAKIPEIRRLRNANV